MLEIKAKSLDFACFYNMMLNIPIINTKDICVHKKGIHCYLILYIEQYISTQSSLRDKIIDDKSFSSPPMIKLFELTN